MQNFFNIIAICQISILNNIFFFFLAVYTEMRASLFLLSRGRDCSLLPLRYIHALVSFHYIAKIIKVSHCIRATHVSTPAILSTCCSQLLIFDSRCYKQKHEHKLANYLGCITSIECFLIASLRERGTRRSHENQMRFRVTGEHILLTGDDSDSVGNVRPGKATLTTPPAKEKRKNFFKKPVNIRRITLSRLSNAPCTSCRFLSFYTYCQLKCYTHTGVMFNDASCV